MDLICVIIYSYSYTRAIFCRVKKVTGTCPPPHDLFICILCLWPAYWPPAASSCFHSCAACNFGSLGNHGNHWDYCHRLHQQFCVYHFCSTSLCQATLLPHEVCIHPALTVVYKIWYKHFVKNSHFPLAKTIQDQNRSSCNGEAKRKDRCDSFVWTDNEFSWWEPKRILWVKILAPFLLRSPAQKTGKVSWDAQVFCCCVHTVTQRVQF